MLKRAAQGGRGGWLALPAAIWLILFFVMPLLIVLVMSFMSRGSNATEYVLPFTLENYRQAFEDVYRSMLFRSISLAFQATLLCFILGYPLAFFISTRRRNWVRNLSLFLVILPFWTNFLVRTYAWITILGRRGILNEFLLNILPERFGIELIDKPLSIINTETAVLIGLVYGYLPFMVLPIYASIERLDFRLVEAGHDLGANDWRVFWRVVFPLTLPGVVAGWLLVFIPSIGAFITPDLLGGTSGFMIGNQIHAVFAGKGGAWTLGSALSILMMLIVMAAVLLYSVFTDAEQTARINTALTGLWRRLQRAIWGEPVEDLNALPDADHYGMRSPDAPIRYNWRETLLQPLLIGGLAVLAWANLDGLLLQVIALATCWAVIGGVTTPLIYARKGRSPAYGNLMGILLGTSGAMAGMIITIWQADSETGAGWIASGIGFLTVMLPFWILVPPMQPDPGGERIDHIQIYFDRLMRRVGRGLLFFAPLINYIFLWLPIVLLVIYSFNDSQRSSARWQGFTTRWYENLYETIRGTNPNFAARELVGSLETSLIISLIGTAIATVIGTMVAMALVRSRFPGKRLIDSLLYLPVVIPDITQGISLMVFFGFLINLLDSLTGYRFSLGKATVIIAHVSFNISFVAIVVRARMVDLNPRLEEAARDLGANEWRTFWRITYPLLLPGIIAGSLLAFTLALDDYVITFFAGGSVVDTLSIFVYGLVKRSVTPDVNAISTLLILISTLLISISLLLQGRNAVEG